MGLHFALCHSGVDEILEIVSGEKTAWTGSASSGSIVINAPDLYGGEDKEGGIAGTIDVEIADVTHADSPVYLGFRALDNYDFALVPYTAGTRVSVTNT